MAENKEIKRFIALENTMRFFSDGIDRKVFFNIEFLLDKFLIHNKSIDVELFINTSDNVFSLFSRVIHFSHDKVRFHDMHEDPIIEIDNKYAISMPLEREQLKEQMRSLKIVKNDILFFTIKAYEKETNREILNEKVDIKEIPWSNIWNDELNTEFVSDYKIKTNKNAVLTYHMNDNNAIYKEETFVIKKNEVVDFQKYLEKNTYLGIQFTIDEDGLDIEEKYIVKGQKGIYESNLLKVNDNIYYSNIVFNNKFLVNLSENEFVEINNINELINFYRKKKHINFFEMDYHYLIENYKKYNTYSQTFVFSSNNKSNFFHIDQEMCRNCKHNSKCLQNIPSNLSEQLYKKNIKINNEKECDIYQLFNI